MKTNYDLTSREVLNNSTSIDKRRKSSIISETQQQEKTIQTNQRRQSLRTPLLANDFHPVVEEKDSKLESSDNSQKIESEVNIIDIVNNKIVIPSSSLISESRTPHNKYYVLGEDDSRFKSNFIDKSPVHQKRFSAAESRIITIGQTGSIKNIKIRSEEEAKNDLSINEDSSLDSNNVDSDEYKNFVQMLDKEFSKDIDKLIKNNPEFSKSRLALSSVIGIGYGAAMMPIFNDQVYGLKDYGIDVHSSEAAFICSTINTLIVASSYAILTIYNCLTEMNNANDVELPSAIENMLNTNTEYVVSKTKKISSAISTLMPLGLLWGVELHNKEVTQSEGFDKFLQWATVATIPLLIVKALECYKQLDKFVDDKTVLTNMTDKVLTYGLSGISLVGKAICYTSIASEFCKKIGFGEEASYSIGIVVGGILSSSIDTINQYISLKSVFNTKTLPDNKKNAAIAAFSCLEAVWFTLPIISAGVQNTKNWSELVQGLLFVPTFLSGTISETSSFYNAFKFNTESIGFKKLACDMQLKYQNNFRAYNDNSKRLQEQKSIVDKAI